MVDYPEMITIREAAKRTGLSYDSIRKMVNAGELTYIKVGKKFLINAGKLCEFLNGGINV